MEAVHILPDGATREETEAHLKATLDGVIVALFGEGAEWRWAPDSFPFTHPSFEVRSE
jgi:phenylalanyl-tRNA synthetase alpha subunit